MSAGNTVFSIFSFLTFVLVSVPLFWHFEAWNAGMCLYIIWAALGNLVYFVNSVVWEGNTTNWAPVWCDISTKFMVGLTIGLPAASLCINRRLFKVANIRKVVVAKAEKRRDVLIDLCIGLGVPLIVMALQYIPQSHRFDIFEDIGCMPNNPNTWVAFLVTQVPIIIVTVISGAYSIASAIAFKRREIELRILLSSTSAPSPNRYLRLMCLAGINVVLTCFIVAAGIIYSVNFGFQPWVSWDHIHSSFSQIDQQPATIWRSDPNRLAMLELPCWVVVIYGLLFFAFFGFALEARENYSRAYTAIVRCLGFRKSEKSNVKDSDTTTGLPITMDINSVYMQRDNASTRNSDDSFESDMGLPKPKFKEFSPLSSLDSIEMPVFHDVGSFLRHESPHSSMATSFPVENFPKSSQNQSSFLDGANMLALQDVSGFLHAPDSQATPRVHIPAISRPSSIKPQVPAKNPPIVSARSPNVTPNVNTPPPHRPYSFPASVTSCASPPPQIVILPPLPTSAVPQSSASSESMYSMGTATDVSPHGGLFPFPLMPSSPPSQTLPLPASFLELGPPKNSSFLDFDDPPPEPRTRDWLSPRDHV